MSVQDMIDLLMDIPNKSIEFVIPIETGYASACVANSDIVKTLNGEKVFVVMPCKCHQDDSEVMTELRVNAFDFNRN